MVVLGFLPPQVPEIGFFSPVDFRTRSGFSRGDQFYASYPVRSELLTDTTKLYKSALGNCFEVEEWGPIE
ncbi:hypothetical protein L2E82_07181 [Cichorium intybus]|uniref:Uncharacterized protein n=1 Tax=Cichorium intybus TaxID=13427 RepID=A0ACB9G520_CICIN|nr:hypothetical protein L2E82_07181 [Cichorium intybus]